MVLTCAACGRRETISVQRCLGCGVEALVDGPDDDEREQRERLDRVAPSAPRVRCDAPIASVLDGLERRACILVTGEPSAGKSTEIAALSTALGWRTAWLDAEMNKARVLELFCRVGATRAHRARVERLGPPLVRTWQDAVARVREADRLVVVDSLHEWAPSEGARQELLTAALELSERALVIVVAHWAREGHAAGSLRADHRVAACVTVTRERVESTKCWWAPLASVERRHDRGARRAGAGSGS